MVIRSIKRYNVLNINSDNNGIDFSLGETLASIKGDHDRIASLLERYKGVQKRRGKNTKIEEEQWSISKEECESDHLSPFIRDLKVLHKAVSVHLPEILSRILHAASALYTELSRGYFAPLCTVALACISRMRVLILHLGRDSVLQFQRSIGWLQSDFLKLVTKGGELEKQTGLTIHQVKRLLLDCEMEQDLLNKFMEPDHNEHVSKMQKLKQDKVMRRGGSSGSMQSDRIIDSVKHEVTASNENEALAETEQDLIGELVDTSTVGAHQSQTPFDLAEKKDTGDRNLEMLALLKEKKAVKSKKRKTKDSSGELEERKIKVSKMGKKSSDTAKEDRGEVKQPKKKKKSKKKSKDVIDDIFDGF